MKNIVVNADDFGKNASVSGAILECLCRQWITQTTLMVNMPYADEAVSLARANGVDGRIGLHLNFTEGVPLTQRIKNFRAICDESGKFFPHRYGYRRCEMTPEAVSAITEEMQAQIEKYLAYQLPLLHCDSHHHIHHRLGFAELLFPLLRASGFKTVRNRSTVDSRPLFRSIYRRLLNLHYQKMIHHAGLDTTQGFGGWEGGDLSRWVGFRSFELMVHPDYDAGGDILNITDYKQKTGPAMKLLGDML